MTRLPNTSQPKGPWLFVFVFGWLVSPIGCGGPIPTESNAGGGAGGSHSSGTGGAIISSVPSGAGTSAGGGGGGDVEDCNKLLVVFRDFRGCDDETGPRHPDMEQGNWVEDRGIPDPKLGSDKKPVYGHGDSPTKTVKNAESFSQWYRDVEGVNKRIESSLTLSTSPSDPTLKIYDNSSFFPLDGQGWGNQRCQSTQHNYGFTTEIHTIFTYKGGETFTFRGDDDVFVYLDGKLVIDLGGIHVAQTQTVKMDEQGLTKGQTYPLDIFHAERHVTMSNFRMETRFECLRSTIIP